MNFINTTSNVHKSINVSNHFIYTSEIFQITSPNDLTVEFFKGIYTYPPKIKLKFDKLDDFSDFKKVDDIFFQKEDINIDSEFNTIDSYSNSFLNKKFTSKFYSLQARKLEKSLDVVPVYVVLNGYRELITSSSRPLFSAEIANSQNFFFRQAQRVCEFPNLTKANSPSKLGLVFMNRNDAEVYLEDVLSRWDSNAAIVGASVHCVSLSSVYKLMRENSFGLDFRIVPNMKELKLLLNKYAGKSNIVFDNAQHQVRLRTRPLSFTPRLKNFYLGDKATPFYKFLSNNEYFKGVPIYIVQVSNVPRNIFSEGGLNVINITDSLLGGCLNTFQTFFGMGQNSTFQTSSKLLDNSKNTVDYVFFNYKQASSFSNKHSRLIRRFPGGYLFKYMKLDNFSRKPSIYVTNLEDLLNSKDVSSATELRNLKKLGKDFIQSIDVNDNREIYFIPDEESVNSFNDIKVKSFVANYKENLVIKYKVLKSIMSTLLQF